MKLVRRTLLTGLLCFSVALVAYSQTWIPYYSTNLYLNPSNAKCGIGTGSSIPEKLSVNESGTYDPFGVRINNSLKFVISNSGKVGIGTGSTPSYLLHVAGDIYANGGWVRVSGQKGIYFQSYGGGLYMTDATWIRTYGNKSFYHNSGIMRTDGTFQVGSGGSRFIVDGEGMVGIADNTPSYELDVNGDINFTGDLRYMGNVVDLGGGGGDSFWESATGGINYADGNVGIGIQTPYQKLHLMTTVEGWGYTQTTLRLSSESMGSYGQNILDHWDIIADGENHDEGLKFVYSYTMGNQDDEIDPTIEPTNYSVRAKLNSQGIHCNRFIDLENENYYLDPANVSNCNSLYLKDKLSIYSEYPNILLNNNNTTNYSSDISFANNGTVESKITYNKYTSILTLEVDDNQALTIMNSGMVKVNGTLQAEKVEVRADVVPDYVFKKDYKLRSLEEVESFINEKGHLPGMRSEEEVMEEGNYNLGEMNVLLLEKIEELTLYILELNKEIEQLKAQNLKE